MRAALLFFGMLTLVPRSAWAQGNPLGPEFRVNTYTTVDQAHPSVAFDAAGNFVVVWESHGQYGFYSSIVGQRYESSGAPSGAEFPVAVSGNSQHTLPSVAADSAGNFVVIWEETPLDDANILGQRYASSGTPLGVQFEVTGISLYKFTPSVASDTAGNFVVVWGGRVPADGSGDAVFGRRYASTGPPLGSEFRVNTFTTGNQFYPSVAVDSSGNFVVVWKSIGQDGAIGGVFGQRYAGSGASLGPEFRINTYTTGDQQHPSVAAVSSGNFVVVWQSLAQDGSGDGIFGQRFDSSGAPQGPEFQVNTFTTGDQIGPSVAADTSGNLVVVWNSVLQDGAAGGIFGQRYDSSGAPLGPEFRVNTYTTGVQAEPAVAADPSGDFVVVWESNLQDGSGYGVFGQRWRPILPAELMRFRVE